MTSSEVDCPSRNASSCRRRFSRACSMLLSSSRNCWRAVSRAFQACATPILIWFCASRSAACACSCCARAALIWRGRSRPDRKVYFRPMPKAQSVSVSSASSRYRSYWPNRYTCGFSDASCTRTPAPAWSSSARSCASCGCRSSAARVNPSSVPGDVPTTNSGVIGVTGPSLRNSSARAWAAASRSLSAFWYSRSLASRATVACNTCARVANPSRSSDWAWARCCRMPSRTSRRTVNACSARLWPK